MNRVSSKDINKLQLEGLVKAGVFDVFEKDSNKWINVRNGNTKGEECGIYYDETVIGMAWTSHG